MINTETRFSETEILNLIGELKGMERKSFLKFVDLLVLREPVLANSFSMMISASFQEIEDKIQHMEIV